MTDVCFKARGYQEKNKMSHTENSPIMCNTWIYNTSMQTNEFADNNNQSNQKSQIYYKNSLKININF